MSEYGVFSSPYFHAFGLNTEIYGAFYEKSFVKSILQKARYYMLEFLLCSEGTLKSFNPATSHQITPKVFWCFKEVQILKTDPKWFKLSFRKNKNFVVPKSSNAVRH